MKRTTRILPAVALLCATLAGSTHHATADDLPGLAAQPASYFYTGKPYDEDLGGYAFAFRTYDPGVNRWMTLDPSGYPNGANNRAYVGNNPVTQIDPMGLEIKVASGQPQNATATAIQQQGGGDGFGITISAGTTNVAAKLSVRQNDHGCFQAYVTAPGVYTANFNIQLASDQQNWAIPLVGTANITAATRNDASVHEQGHLSIHSASAARVSAYYDAQVVKVESGWYKTEKQARDKATLMAGGFLSSAILRYGEIQQIYNPNHTLDNAFINQGIWRRTNPGWSGQFLAAIAAEKVDFKLPSDNTDQCE